MHWPRSNQASSDPSPAPAETVDGTATAASQIIALALSKVATATPAQEDSSAPDRPIASPETAAPAGSAPEPQTGTATFAAAAALADPIEPTETPAPTATPAPTNTPVPPIRQSSQPLTLLSKKSRRLPVSRLRLQRRWRLNIAPLPPPPPPRRMKRGASHWQSSDAQGAAASYFTATATRTLNRP
ncbi:MAG: hypothetical protein IPK16_30380 [Anaerolineales bacterium]|nr:hypothetical protein [Anaerolineales bacterium]